MSPLAEVLAAPESYESGPTGLLVIVLLGVGIFFLARSMIKHIRKVPASFDDPPPDPGEPAPMEPEGPDADGPPRQ